MAGLKPCECKFPFKYTDPSGAIAVSGGGAPFHPLETVPQLHCKVSEHPVLLLTRMYPPPPYACFLFMQTCFDSFLADNELSGPEW